MMMLNNKYLKVLFVILIYFTNESIQQSELENFINDDSDASIVKYTLLKSSTSNGFTDYVLNATTLKWLDENVSDSYIWYHTIHVIVPNGYTGKNVGFCFLEGGKQGDQNSGNVNNVAMISTTFNMIGVIIKQIPNQPIKFKDDPANKQRSEDDAIAYSFSMFFNSSIRQSNPSNYNRLPLLMPMTKAAKRGMDLAKQFLTDSNLVAPKQFIVSGISKRGWTTWLSSVIPSVIGAAPIVYDMLNFYRCFHNQFVSLGGAYSFAFNDYYSTASIGSKLDTQEFDELLNLIDPFRYLDSFKSTKLLLTVSSSDEFMFPANLNQFWRELQLKNGNSAFVWRIPNAGHDINPTQISKTFSNIKNFILLNSQIQDVRQMPQLNWKFGNNATHAITEVYLTNLDAFDSYEVKVYKSQTLDSKRIDFRAHALNAFGQPAPHSSVWQSELIDFSFKYDSTKAAANPLRFEYALARNENVYQAFYITVILKLKQYPFDTNQVPDQALFIVSSPTNIIPEYYPARDCLYDECIGRLV